MSTSYSTSLFRAGLKIMQDGEPCVILENEFVKPGKGQAFNRVRLRKLLSGKLVEKTFKSGETVQSADVADVVLQYLYADDQFFYFMDPNSFEQISASLAAVGEAKKWLVGQSDCTVTLWNQQPIAVTPPNFVSLEIVETDPGVKGDTAGSGGKPAKLSTGAVIRVPLFVQTGELVRVDTRTAEYISRQK